MHERGHERPGAAAIETGDVDGMEREALLGHERALQAAALSEEMDLMPPIAELVGKGQCRIDVARGTARGNGDGELTLIGNGKPSLGTSAPSKRRLSPKKWTSCPRSRSSSARANAGLTWPAVPPAAMATVS